MGRGRGFGVSEFGEVIGIENRGVDLVIGVMGQGFGLRI